jgi:hypothetical protein
MEDVKHNVLKDEEDSEDVRCTYICPGLPFNSVVTGYKHTKQT